MAYCFSVLSINFEQVNTKHILDDNDTGKRFVALLPSIPRSDMSTTKYDVSNN